MQFLVAGITLGFLGSFHCIGMCGPIALALPVYNRPTAVKYFLIISYNLGRMTTYAAFGLFAGIIGYTFVLAGLQQALSITAGCVLLIGVFFSFQNGGKNSILFSWIKKNLSGLFSKGSGASFFLIGLLNGLLPCGLVYVGIAGAAATGDLFEGALFMAAFGAGTLPMMIALPLFGSSITLEVRKKMQKAVPVMITVMAMLLILRGLNLGIPYVSPKIDKDSHVVSCHSETDPKNHRVIKCSKPGAH